MADGVSFVVNVYGKAPRLAPAVAGLLAQAGEFEREYIFLDGSPDGAGAAQAAALTQGRNDVRIERHADHGPAAAANIGARIARYGFVRFLDGDDRVAEQGTAAMLRIAQATRAGVVVAPALRVADGAGLDFDETAIAAGSHCLPADPLAIALNGAIAALSGALYRRCAFMEVGGCDERVFLPHASPLLRIARKWPVALAEAASWAAPRRPGQLHGPGSKQQMLHDLNATLHYFLRDHPDLDGRYRRQALRRAAGRAHKWARRVEGQGLVNPWFWLHLRSYLPVSGNATRLVGRTRAAFRLSHPVREPRLAEA